MRIMINHLLLPMGRGITLGSFVLIVLILLHISSWHLKTALAVLFFSALQGVISHLLKEKIENFWIRIITESIISYLMAMTVFLLAQLHTTILRISWTWVILFFLISGLFYLSNHYKVHYFNKKIEKSVLK